MEFLKYFLPAVILALTVFFIRDAFVRKTSLNERGQIRERFPFWIAIILGVLAIFGHGIAEMIIPSSDGGFVPETQIIYLFSFTPYFAINFLGFGFAKKKTALLILGISTAILLIAISIFLS